jgi:hypothetical protein
MAAGNKYQRFNTYFGYQLSYGFVRFTIFCLRSYTQLNYAISNSKDPFAFAACARLYVTNYLKKLKVLPGTFAGSEPDNRHGSLYIFSSLRGIM